MLPYSQFSLQQDGNHSSCYIVLEFHLQLPRSTLVFLSSRVSEHIQRLIEDKGKECKKQTTSDVQNVASKSSSSSRHIERKKNSLEAWLLWFRVLLLPPHRKPCRRIFNSKPQPPPKKTKAALSRHKVRHHDFQTLLHFLLKSIVCPRSRYCLERK